MNQGSRPLAVLFVDISESSKLYLAHGDQTAFALISALLDELALVVASFDGQVVDRIGDELMTTFGDLQAAMGAAVGLQQATRQFSQRRPPSEHVSVRVGLHFGEVSTPAGRPAGRAVYRAKRLVDSAKAHQIILDAETLEHTQGPGQWALRTVHFTQLKGQDSPGALMELLWNEEESTIDARTARQPMPVQGTLRLEAGDHVTQLAAYGRLSVGRLSPCGLVLDAAVVSRTHAHIIGRASGFYLKDESTNGSFVSPDASDQTHFVHREDTPLEAAGWIGFGRAPEPGTPHSVRYDVFLSEDTE